MHEPSFRKAVPGWIALTLALAAGSAQATVGEKIDAAGRAASNAATKTEAAVKRGVKAAASGVERGARAAGSAADRGARALGVPGAGKAASQPAN